MKLGTATGAAVVALTLWAAPARAEEAPAAPPPEVAGSAATTTTAEPSSPTTHRTVWPWIIMGTGVALITTAVVLEVNAVRQDDKREAAEVKLTALASRPAGDPEKVQLQQAIDEHGDSASSGRTAALIIGTVGFLAVAGSVVLWFVEGSSSSAPSKAAQRKPSLVPSFGPGYAGAAFGASF